MREGVSAWLPISKTEKEREGGDKPKRSAKAKQTSSLCFTSLDFCSFDQTSIITLPSAITFARRPWKVNPTSFHHSLLQSRKLAAFKLDGVFPHPANLPVNMNLSENESDEYAMNERRSPSPPPSCRLSFERLFELLSLIVCRNVCADIQEVIRCVDSYFFEDESAKDNYIADLNALFDEGHVLYLILLQKQE
ncbi:hypothetical protein TNCV_215881 [Trichonephila clavipes]|nr:hypothetical protein TNCV_215881 [Trichonephila clavipes]